MRKSIGKVDDYRKPLRISLLWLLSLIRIHSSASAQSQTGFISIDCGGIGRIPYIDTINGLEWQPDGALMTMGSIATIKDPNLLGSGITSRELTTLRYFEDPKINKFCYNLGPLSIGNFYLIRTSFLHGNYNGKSESYINFDLLLEGDLWDSIVVSNTSIQIRKEVYIQAKTTNMSVCVASNSSSHTPFISSIELRPIKEGMATTRVMNKTNHLVYITHRYNFGASTTNDIRYPDDNFDRIWYAHTQTKNVRTQSPITSYFDEAPPNHVMQSAFLAPDGIWQNFTFTGLEPGIYIFHFYFAEIEINVENGVRVFDMYKDDSLIYGQVDIKKASDASFQTFEYIFESVNISKSTLILKLQAIKNSRLGPIWNAFELLRYSNAPPTTTTFTNDVEALSEVKMRLGLNNWTGDPCLPLAYPYPWVACSLNNPPRVTSLLLPNMNLQGGLPPSINFLSEIKEINFENNSLSGGIPIWSALLKLERLNLGNNHLSGAIPDFLADLPSLVELSLQYNNFTGGIPIKIQEKVINSKLKLNVTGNLFLCPNNCALPLSPNASVPPANKYPSPTPPTPKSWKKIVIIVVVIVGCISILSIIGVVVYIYIRTKKLQPSFNFIQPNRNPSQHEPNLAPPQHEATLPHAIPDPIITTSSSNEIVEAKVVEFTYEEILVATNNFKERIGSGAFGDVFFGRWNEDRIAVKVLSKDYDQGVREFLNEIKSLTKVHHMNIVPLVGYCHKEERILVYKYMSNKSLRGKLDVASSISFPWRARLLIALDVAQGLEYFHTLCKPIIIHGAVKSRNILVNEDMQGRIGDLGLSGFYSNDMNKTKTISGSMGYLDPLFLQTGTLDVKNDVYSFGVVLLEIITGRSALLENYQPQEESQLAIWVRNNYKRAQSVRNLLDESLKSDERGITKTILMVLEIAMDCLNGVHEDRPSMHDVVVLLTSALALQDHISSATSKSS